MTDSFCGTGASHGHYESVPDASAHARVPRSGEVHAALGIDLYDRGWSSRRSLGDWRDGREARCFVRSSPSLCPGATHQERERVGKAPQLLCGDVRELRPEVLGVFCEAH